MSNNLRYSDLSRTFARALPLSDTKRQELEVLVRTHPNLGEAYRLKVLFNDLWVMRSKEAASAFLNQWCGQVDLVSIPALVSSSKPSKPTGMALSDLQSLGYELTHKSWTPNPTKKGQLHEQTQHTVQAKSSY